jgi:hypothetical protein
VRVNGVVVAKVGLTPDDWWQTLIYSDLMPNYAAGLLGLLAAGVLALPLGYFARGLRVLLAVGVAALATPWICTAVLPSVTPTWSELVVIAVWILGGAALRRLSLRSSPH